jgi:hypothetical protein
MRVKTMKELNLAQVEHVNGGSVAMTLATGWAGTVAGAAVGAVVGGPVGVFVGAAAGFIVGVGSGIGYSLSTKQTVVIATCDV